MPSYRLSDIRARPRIASNAALLWSPLLRIKKPFLSEIYNTIPVNIHGTVNIKDTDIPGKGNIISMIIPINMATPISIAIPISARRTFSRPFSKLVLGNTLS